MMTLSIGFIIFLLIGCLVGFLSGLLGVGGGVVIVPALMWVFQYYKALAIPENKMMHVAIGTSLAAMIITVLVAIYAHHKHRNIVWRLCFQLLPGTIVGVILGAWITSLLKSYVLSILFGILLILIAIYIFFLNKEKQENSRVISLNWTLYTIAGFVIGVCSGMLGVGGGSLVIPLLLFLHFPINKASGTSVTVVLPIAVVGTLSFIITGNISHIDIPFGTGFIYWPAFLGIGIGSVLAVSFGTWVGRRANKILLRRVFSVLLLLIALELFIQ